MKTEVNLAPDMITTDGINGDNNNTSKEDYNINCNALSDDNVEEIFEDSGLE